MKLAIVVSFNCHPCPLQRCRPVGPTSLLFWIT
jgi:hypothetical protein